MSLRPLPPVLIALLALAAPVPAQPPPTSAPAAAALPAPALSPDVQALRRELHTILEGPGWRDARHAVLVVSLDRGDTLFSLAPDLPLVPASNMKLLTTAAALYYLGPDFRYSTYLLADGPIRDGVLHGDLVLYGTGDPAISGRMLGGASSVLQALADSLAAAGVREVTGAVLADGSYFDDTWIGPGWEDDDRLAWYAAPVGALSFAENMISVRVLPGPVGRAARVRTAPESDGLALENRVRTVSRGSTRVRFEHEGGRLVVSGQIRRGHPGVARSVPVADPANYAAGALRALLRERGIHVAEGVREVREPRGSPVRFAAGAAGSPGGAPPRVVGVHLSPTLAELARVTNHVSHNLFAEALLKTVGRVVYGEGTFGAGARAVERFVERETGVVPAPLRVVDGSGLSKENRLTARALVHLLDRMADDDPAGAFLASLPEAAHPQGLRRLQGTAAAANLRAKTGTLQSVSSLSGYVRTADGERLAFSILANGVPSTARAKRLEDAIGARLAEFRRDGNPGRESVGLPIPVRSAPAMIDRCSTGCTSHAGGDREPEDP